VTAMNLGQPARPLPRRALILSVAALLVPVTGALFFPEWTSDQTGVLLWLTALVPAFLLTYYRGWMGASLALAVGMAVLAVTQVVVLAAGIRTPNWTLLLGVVVVFLLVGMGIGWLAELLHRERRAAEQTALTDPLTELPNRRHAYLFLGTATAAAERGQPLSVVLFDLDHFKAFNDRYGHAAGDEVLRIFGRVLKKVTRRMDVGARVGGEEFISVLWGANAEGAGHFLARFHHELGKNPSPWGPISVSAGVACFGDGWGSPDLLVAAADRALYSAKAAGRAQAHLAGPSGCVRLEIPEFRPVPPAPPRLGRPSRWKVGGDPSQGEDADVDLPTAEAGGVLKGRTGGEAILVVEDDPAALRTIGRVLQRLGYQVRLAGDPDEALTLLHRSPIPPDLLLTDVVMPAMSGFTLVDRALALHPGLRVLYMSGYSHSEVAGGGVPGRVAGFIQKPMTVEELTARVREILDAREEVGTAEG